MEGGEREMAELKEIARIEKNALNYLKISLNEFQGKKFLDIREWYIPEDSQDLRPTKKGITVSAEIFESFLKALNESQEEISQLLCNDDVSKSGNKE